MKNFFQKKCHLVHYLAYDALTNPINIEKCGIELDESIGWHDEIGFKAGIAGPFQPWSKQWEREVRLFTSQL